jgi:aminoglycoside 2'-N-acetyltransferase I
MSRRRVQTAQTDELDPERFAEITEVCEAAFGTPFAPVWDRVGPGLHVTAEVDGRIAAHAMIVDRPLYFEHETDVGIDTGYVENVATHPDLQGHGHAAAVMREINRILHDEYALGGLITTKNAFYAKIGWETWRGPSWVRMADGQRIRSADHDGQIMILRTSRTPARLDVAGAVAVDWRPGTAW